MNKEMEITLVINDAPIETNPFVKDFIIKTVTGMVSSLKGTGEIESIDISLKESALSINVNESPVIIIKPFVEEIVLSTLAGMVSTLKGAAGDVQNLFIKITPTP